MTIIVDTSLLVASLVPRDAHHERAQAILHRIMRHEFGTPTSSDLVLSEGLTLIRARIGDRRISERYAGFFHGSTDRHVAPLRMQHASADIIERAVELHFRLYDQHLSVVDCVLIAMAEDNDAPVATFDARFNGIVPIVSA